MDLLVGWPTIWKKITLPETKIAPENWWLEDEFPFGMAYFQVRTVSFKEGMPTATSLFSQFPAGPIEHQLLMTGPTGNMGQPVAMLVAMFFFAKKSVKGFSNTRWLQLTDDLGAFFLIEIGQMIQGLD